MRKTLIAAIGVIALLVAGTAYAHMYGYGGMQGYGGHMWGYNDEDSTKFLNDTADIRRELHEKRFELNEAYRAGDKAKAEAIEKELDELRDQLAEKGGFERGERRFGKRGWGYGPRAGGYGYCGGPYGW